MKKTTLLAVVYVLAQAFFSARAAEPARINIQAKEGQVAFLVGSSLVGQYHVEPGAVKPYFWPLLGPDKTRLTRAWPMEKAPAGGSTDHPHQKSAWFCHGDVIPEGLTLKSHVRGVAGIDFWSEGRGHGKIVCTRVTETSVQAHAGQVSTQNEWRTADDEKVLDETRVIHFYDFGDTRLFVFDIDLTASVAPITFGDTKEGSFGVRVNDVIREQKGNGKIQNAEGKVGEKRCWGQISAWCDYSGRIDREEVGVAIFDDPDNPYPACWHSRGYGLMAANPFGRAKSGFPDMKGRTDLVKLGTGQHLKFRYGILLHPGDAVSGKVADYYQEFVKLKGK
jgi:hypothetical protein